MIQYLEGNTTIKPRGKERITSIVEIIFEDGLILYVFPGSISKNDILIKFKDENLIRTKIRQPSHIHWVVDILIKKENESDLINEFLKNILIRWNEIAPIHNRSYNTIINSMSLSKTKDFIKKYAKLNSYGFFTIEFIIHLMELLMIQEKTNYPEAYMFKRVLEEIIKGNDLYAMVSKAIR